MAHHPYIKEPQKTDVKLIKITQVEILHFVAKSRQMTEWINKCVCVCVYREKKRDWFGYTEARNLQ